MTRPTHGRWTLDYIERTGPVDRVGLVLTDPGHIDSGDDAECDGIAAAVAALSGNNGEVSDWMVSGPDTVEALIPR